MPAGEEDIETILNPAAVDQDSTILIPNRGINMTNTVVNAFKIFFFIKKNITIYIYEYAQLCHSYSILEFFFFFTLYTCSKCVPPPPEQYI